jgi:small subunit ribosomal protein S6
MAFYENVLIARQDISSAQVDTLVDGLAAVLTEHGGEVKKREYWGLRNLSFRIRKNRKGHYVLLNIEGPAAAVSEMERTARINEDVLRYLTVRVEELEEGPSAVMQNRGRSDDRPRRGFGDRDRGFGDRDRGFGDRDRGGFGDRDHREPREPRDPGAAPAPRGEA